MAQPQSEASPPSRTRIALTILFHSSSAIWSTILSKSALNGIDSPVTLLALQTTVQVLLLTGVGLLTGWIEIRRPLSAWKSLLPLTAARLVGILAKTYCLASVNASVYQIARGLLLPFTLLLSLVVLRPRPHYPPLALGGCAMVMAGFGAGMAADYAQMLTSAKGIMFGVGSSFTTAVESVVVKKFLSKSSEGTWQMVWMSNVMALVFYGPLLAATGGLGIIAALLTGQPIAPADAAAAAADAAAAASSGRQFLNAALLTGLSSFFLTIATFMQIDVTSPTTHMIVTAARGVAQSSMAIIFLGETLTTDRVGSMILILSGSTIYGWACDRYQRAKKQGGDYKPLAGEEGRAEHELEKAGEPSSSSKAERQS